MKAEYGYLLQEREFIKTKENIFKVGKTKQENSKRFKQYPKDTILLLQTVCIDCDKTEKAILTAFKKIYKQRKDIGIEYFEGDHNQMLRDINEIIGGNVEDNSIMRPPFIITDPEILDFIIEAENNDFNPITFFKNAILRTSFHCPKSSEEGRENIVLPTHVGRSPKCVINKDHIMHLHNEF